MSFLLGLPLSLAHETKNKKIQTEEVDTLSYGVFLLMSSIII